MKKDWWRWAAFGLLAAALLGGYAGWKYWRRPREPVYGGKTVPQWVEALKADNPAQARSAADALVGLGADGVTVLHQARKDSDLRVHRRAVAALVRVGAPAAPGLVQSLPTSGVRAETALVRLGPAGVPALVEGLRDDKVAKDAARVLGGIGRRAREAAPALIALLQDQQANAEARAAAALALGQVGPAPSAEADAGAAVPDDVLSALAAALGDAAAPARVRASAAEALGKIGPRARSELPALVASVRGKDEDVAAAACWPLAQVGGGTTALAAGVRTGQEQRARAAVGALIRLGPAARPAVPLLVPALKSDKTEGEQARDALARLGPAAAPGLAAALKDDDPELRRAAAEVLRAVGPAARAALPALAEALEDDDPLVRFTAATALARVEPAKARPALPLLVCALGGPQGDNAARALGEMGAEAAEAVPALLARAMHRGIYAPESVATIRALILIGPPAVPALTDTLRAGLWEEGAVLTLGWIGPDTKAAVPALRAAFKKPGLRGAAALALARIAPSDSKEVLEGVIADLERDGAKVSREALLALAELGPRAAPAVPALRQRLGEREDVVALLAVLGAIGPGARAAATDLVVLLSDTSPGVADAAKAALAQIGPGAVPALTAGLKSPNARVRQEAAATLGHLGPGAKDAAPALTAALGDADLSVSSHAAQALGLLGPAARGAVPALTEWLGSWETTRRNAAVRALRGIGPAARSAAPALVECLIDPDPLVRAGAAGALLKINPPKEDVAPALLDALHDQADGVRLAAAWALARLDPSQADRAASVLIDICRSTLSPEAAEALAALAPGRMKEVVPPLEATLYGSHAPRRVAASRLLVRVDRKNAARVVPYLVAALDSRQGPERRSAAEALGALGPAAAEAATALRRLAVGDLDKAARKAAAEALAKVIGKADP